MNDEQTQKVKLTAKQKLAIVRQEFAEHKNVIEALEKKLVEANKSRDNYYNQLNSLQAQINEIHSMLDCLPHAPARQSSEADQWSRVTFSVPARIAGWIANVKLGDKL